MSDDYAQEAARRAEEDNRRRLVDENNRRQRDALAQQQLAESMRRQQEEDSKRKNDALLASQEFAARQIQQQAEEVEDPVEPRDERRADADHHAAHHQRAEDAPEEHAMLVHRRHAEVREDQRDDEDVVDAEAFLDDVAGQVFDGRAVAVVDDVVDAVDVTAQPQPVALIAEGFALEDANGSEESPAANESGLAGRESAILDGEEFVVMEDVAMNHENASIDAELIVYRRGEVEKASGKQCAKRYTPHSFLQEWASERKERGWGEIRFAGLCKECANH